MKMRKVPVYRGKTTCCHSQALLTAFFSRDVIPDPWLFEICTTIPFGIIHIPGDPNRLLDCYLDPDLGLDRALDILDIPYEVCFWAKGADGIEAVQALYDWCADGPVVLGPLNMDGLSYLFHSELFHRMDHYVVALDVRGEKVRLCDPEGFTSVFLPIDDLLNAWRGDRIPEGRGEFIMRRIMGNTTPTYNQETFVRTLRLAAKNLTAARKMKYGGGQALHSLAHNAQAIESNPSLRRGLTYVIPTRIQRCVFIMEFIRQALQPEYFVYKFEKPLNDALAMLNIQIRLYSQSLANLKDKLQGSLTDFKQIANFEEEITDIFEFIGKEL